MKKFLLPLLFIATLIACNSKPNGYIVNGTLTGEVADSTQVILKKIGDNNRPVSVDSVLITNGSFSFSGDSIAPELHYIFVDKLPGYAVLVLENGVLELTAQKDSLSFAKTTGSPQNDIFSNYLEQSREVSSRAMSIQQDLQKAGMEKNESAVNALRDEMQELQEEHKNFEMDFIASNPNGLISALLIDKALASRAVSAEKIASLYDGLSADIKENKVAKTLLEKITQLKEKQKNNESTAIGKKAPNFSAKNPEGIIAKNLRGNALEEKVAEILN